MRAKIAEVFDSIQGEGIYAGEKQVFVRFYDCNMNCKFCDTKSDAYREYTPLELFEELKVYQGGYHSIAFTGGEPLVQKDFLKGFLTLTRSAGLRNYLESNGTLPDALAEVIGNVDIVAMDFKLPSSTGGLEYWEAHQRFLAIASRKEVFVKIIIGASTDDGDLYRALGIIKKVEPATIVVLQPQDAEPPKVMARKLDWCKAICRQEQITCCVIPQVHKSAGVR